MYAGLPIGISNLTQQGVPWDTNWETIEYGNNTDLWSHNWTPNEINSNTFGVRYLPEIDGTVGAGPNAGWLDCITVTVKYFL